ncbi:MAG: hypothetical protein ACTHU0_16345 [Kofleriaceae bacterium]
MAIVFGIYEMLDGGRTQLIPRLRALDATPPGATSAELHVASVHAGPESGPPRVLIHSRAVQAGLVAILGAALAACSSPRRADPAPAEVPPVATAPEDAGPLDAPAAAVTPEAPDYEVLATGVREITSIAVTGRRVVLGDGDRVLEVPKAAGGTPVVVLALGHHEGEIWFEDQIRWPGGSPVAAWGEEAIAGRVVVRGKRPVFELLRAVPSNRSRRARPRTARRRSWSSATPCSGRRSSSSDRALSSART